MTQRRPPRQSRAIKGSSTTIRDRFVPEDVRRDLDQFMVCVDLTIPQDQLATLAQRCGCDPAAANGETIFQGSSKSDSEVAVTLIRMKQTAFHLTIEFRKGRRSPYRKLPHGRVEGLLAFLADSAQDLKVAIWRESRSIRTEAFATSHPEVEARIKEAPSFTVGNLRMRLTGVDLELALPEAEGKQAGVQLSWGTPRILFRQWTRGQKLTRLQDAFRLPRRELEDATTSLRLPSPKDQ